ncbi:MAG: YijD family membrane protein [Aliivibrio sp.]|uniref:YijD family membrane protein n=1 Tax=Aliivibrio sp. TaxID=1872443 RepID=UPI001A532562|nr:YijD family membrane protein [Aliivibrio sp.]
MQKEQINTERKTLVLAFIAGLSTSAIWASLTISEFTLSIFPIITLVLVIQNVYQEYLKEPMTEGTPQLSLACFFVGTFGYSAFVRAQYPEVGSNFLALVVTMVLVIWVGAKTGVFTRSPTEK